MSAGNSHQLNTQFYVRQAFKLAISLVLFYAFALWINWDVPQYGALAIVIVSMGTRGASIEKGIMRVAGTTMGLVVGMLILACFNDLRWATMVALAINIAVTCYCMQTSHFQYAWYAAAFIPLVVWADNYPQFGNAFYFSTFRWLETLFGVLVYTLVDLVLWPRSASDQLRSNGSDLLRKIQEQFDAYRQSDPKGLDEHQDTRRTEIAGQLSRTVSSLQDALFDSTRVRKHRRLWQTLLGDFQRLVIALEMWHESEVDCLDQPLREFVPNYDAALNKIDVRLSRIIDTWDSSFRERWTSDGQDRDLLEASHLEVDVESVRKLSSFQRAAIQSVIRQLEILDQATRESLQTIGRLNGFEDDPERWVKGDDSVLHRAPVWDSERFFMALFPVAAFVMAWMVWVGFNPPGGARVPMIAGILAILVVRTPINPIVICVVIIASIAFVVAPVCWLLMPALSTGYELLALIFLLSFFFGSLAAKSAVLKSGPLILFFSCAGISNQQSYSFEGPVYGSMMVLVGGVVVALIYSLWVPMRSEQTLLKSLRRVLLNSANYCDAFDLRTDSWGVNETRNRSYTLRSKMVPSIDAMRRAIGRLDFDLYPNNRVEDWQAICDSLQSLAYRLKSFELAYLAMGTKGRDDLASEPSTSVRTVLGSLREVLVNSGDGKRGAVQDANALGIRRLDQDVSALKQTPAEHSADDRELLETYTLLGNLRLIVQAVKATQETIARVDCDEIATPRF